MSSSFRSSSVFFAGMERKFIGLICFCLLHPNSNDKPNTCEMVSRPKDSDLFEPDSNNNLPARTCFPKADQASAASKCGAVVGLPVHDSVANDVFTSWKSQNRDGLGKVMSC